MNDRLAGKVIVVTGSSGIAAAGARRFVAEGAAAWVVARDAAKGASLVDELTRDGGQAGFAAADLRNEAAAVEAVAGASRLSSPEGLSRKRPARIRTTRPTPPIASQLFGMPDVPLPRSLSGAASRLSRSVIPERAHSGQEA